MIDPNKVTNASRTPEELEEFLLFCVVVAGKNADQQSAKLERFLGGRKPFAYVRSSHKAGKLDAALRDVRLGKYSLLGRSFRELAHSGTDLSRATWEQLSEFPGIGIKTSKFFILHSRERQMHGVLDTHVLAWMSEHWDGAGPNRLEVPRHSPRTRRPTGSGRRCISGWFARATTARAAVDWAQFDLDLWRERRGSADKA
jgi:hypothetical protein